MKKKDLVWRELIDAAVTRGERRWDNVDDLAFRAGVAPTTANYALGRLVEIGAVRQHHAGFTVISPDKVLTSLCASRSIKSDKLAVRALADPELDGLLASHASDYFIFGGPEAAVALLGGVNTVSDYSERLVYLRDSRARQLLEHLLEHPDTPRRSVQAQSSGNVTFLQADPRAGRTWGSHTSFAQTYVDLFATPGWQASEFRFALSEAMLVGRDWDQG